MAIVKFNNRKDSTSISKRNKLKRIIEYITDNQKTCQDLIGGLGVDKDTALKRMEIVKKFYGKEGGREYIHFCVSFKGRKNADIIYSIGERIAELFIGFQVLFAVHLNTSNIHIHFVINTVNINDGHKFSQSQTDLQKLKSIINDIIKKSGLDFEEISLSNEENLEYEDTQLCKEDDLIIPMIFYDTEGLIRPIIYNYEYDENT